MPRLPMLSSCSPARFPCRWSPGYNLGVNSMVKACAMLISEFARAANLSPDTVRFYVKLGLLRPEAGRRGGSNPYLEFSRADLARARLVQLARSLGFTLR